MQLQTDLKSERTILLDAEEVYAGSWITGSAAHFLVTHLFPSGLAAVTTLIGLVEVVVSGLAGAWVYREASQPEVRQFSQAARR
jgi:hypothetical protein